MSIEKAAEAMYRADRAYTGLTWNLDTPEATKEIYRNLARAALPHLAVWDKPTRDEVDFVWNEMKRSTIGNAMLEFVRRRNAQFAPPEPPIDPAIEKVRRIITQVWGRDDGDAKIAQIIKVVRETPVAPPVPDPRIAAIVRTIHEGGPASETRDDDVTDLAKRILSALDFLKGTK